MEVFKAMGAVQASLAAIGIGATEYNQGQKFNYRGIATMLNSIAPMLAENALVITPRLMSHEVNDRQTRNGGVMIQSRIVVEFDFVSTIDGSKHTASTIGEGMDSGDKSLAKAHTAAFKTLLIQSFCIPLDGTPDADGESPAEIVTQVQAMPAEEVGVIRDLLRLSETDEQQFCQWIASVETIELIPGDMAGRCRDALNNKIRKLQEQSNAS